MRKTCLPNHFEEDSTDIPVSQSGLPLGQEPDPEDFLPAPRKPPSVLSKVPPRQYARLGLQLLTLAALANIWVWRHQQSDLWSASGQTVFGYGQWYRLLTGMILHADWGHFLANAPLFWIFSWILRGHFGSRAFPWFSLLAGVITHALTIWFYPPQAQLVGASGMVYAMVGMWLTAYWRYETQLRWQQRLLRTLGFILIVLVPTQFDPHVSYLAHSIGFVVGVICGFGLRLRSFA